MSNHEAAALDVLLPQPSLHGGEKWSLHQRVAELTVEFPRYGYRRMSYQLRAEGLSVNHKAAARIMRESGLQARPWRRRTDYPERP